MPAKPSEITNFFWHCWVAAKLLDEPQDSTVIRSHILNAVRKATDCWAGRNGVQYASDDARALKHRLGLPWEQCGLRKEHVIPVGVVKKFVYEELQRPIAVNGAMDRLALSDHEMTGLTPDVVELFHQNPRAWSVARVIRDWTLHAWITIKEDQRFDDKARHGLSIRSRMPQGWTPDQDRFKRYLDCDIKVSLI